MVQRHQEMMEEEENGEEFLCACLSWTNLIANNKFAAEFQPSIIQGGPLKKLPFFYDLWVSLTHCHASFFMRGSRTIEFFLSFKTN